MVGNTEQDLGMQSLNSKKADAICSRDVYNK